MSLIRPISLIFFAVCHSVACLAAEPEWSESELILSGQKSVANYDAAPTSLEIPAAWAIAAKELIAKSNANSYREHGTCLTFKAPGFSESRRAVMRRYAQLNALKSTMDPTEVAAEEAKILRRLNSSPPKMGDGREWGYGKNFSVGNQESMSISYSDPSCENSVSSIHTHPRNPTRTPPPVVALSLADITTSLAGGDFLISAITVNETGMCLLLKTDDALDRVRYESTDTLDSHRTGVKREVEIAELDFYSAANLNSPS